MKNTNSHNKEEKMEVKLLLKKHKRLLQNSQQRSLWYSQVLPNAVENLWTSLIHVLINDALVFTIQ